MEVDAIVNPAHRELLGGGGLDGFIHDAAGPGLLAACRELGGCATGGAKVTPAFDLPSKWVIHTVGPVWKGGQADEDAQLASCYWRSLELARDLGARTLAFPGISTGLHGFPVVRAAAIATHTVRGWLRGSQLPRKVTFVCFDRLSLLTYEDLLDASRPA
jgi:O-acetyl-ADP-ribose deacetylase (regulator of RNase III)